MTFEDIYPLISSEIPGCPVPLRAITLRLALTRFARVTRAWRVQLAQSISATPHALTGLPTGSAPFLVLGRVVSQDRRYNLSPIDRDTARERWQFVDPPDHPTTFYLDGASLVLDAAPPEATTFRLEVALEPASSLAEVPAALNVAGIDMTLARGALSFLYRMSSKEWTSLELANMRYAEFQRDLVELGHRINSGATQVESFARITPLA